MYNKTPAMSTASSSGMSRSTGPDDIPHLQLPPPAKLLEHLLIPSSTHNTIIVDGEINYISRSLLSRHIDYFKDYLFHCLSTDHSLSGYVCIEDIYMKEFTVFLDHIHSTTSTGGKAITPVTDYCDILNVYSLGLGMDIPLLRAESIMWMKAYFRNPANVIELEDIRYAFDVCEMPWECGMVEYLIRQLAYELGRKYERLAQWKGGQEVVNLLGGEFVETFQEIKGLRDGERTPAWE